MPCTRCWKDQKQNSPEDVSFFAIPTSKDLGSNVFSIAFSLEILGGVSVALASHAPLSSFRLPHRVSVAAVPTRTLHGSASDDAKGIGSRPASREPEISDLEVTSVCDENVGWLQVEVEDVARMHVRDSGGELGQDLPDSRFVKLFMLATVFFEPVREVAGRTELSLDVEVACLLPGVDKGDEVRRVVLRPREESQNVDFFETSEAVSAGKQAIGQ